MAHSVGTFPPARFSGSSPISSLPCSTIGSKARPKSPWRRNAEQRWLSSLTDCAPLLDGLRADARGPGWTNAALVTRLLSGRGAAQARGPASPARDPDDYFQVSGAGPDPACTPGSTRASSYESASCTTCRLRSAPKSKALELRNNHSSSTATPANAPKVADSRSKWSRKKAKAAEATSHPAVATTLPGLIHSQRRCDRVPLRTNNADTKSTTRIRAPTQCRRPQATSEPGRARGTDAGRRERMGSPRTSSTEAGTPTPTTAASMGSAFSRRP